MSITWNVLSAVNMPICSAHLGVDCKLDCFTHPTTSNTYNCCHLMLSVGLRLMALCESVLFILFLPVLVCGCLSVCIHSVVSCMFDRIRQLMPRTETALKQTHLSLLNLKRNIFLHFLDLW